MMYDGGGQNHENWRLFIQTNYDREVLTKKFYIQQSGASIVRALLCCSFISGKGVKW